MNYRSPIRKRRLVVGGSFGCRRPRALLRHLEWIHRWVATTRSAPAPAGGRGSGIVPLQAVARQVLHDEPDAEVTLVYGRAALGRAIFAAPLQQLAASTSLRLCLHWVFESAPTESDDPPFTPGKLDSPTLTKVLTGTRLDSFQRANSQWPDPLLLRLLRRWLPAVRQLLAPARRQAQAHRRSANGRAPAAAAAGGRRAGRGRAHRSDLQRQQQTLPWQVSNAALANRWVARDDARNYLTLGDPAVRLRVEDMAA